MRWGDHKIIPQKLYIPTAGPSWALRSIPDLQSGDFFVIKEDIDMANIDKHLTEVFMMGISKWLKR